jgi:HEAT repeat protein
MKMLGIRRVLLAVAVGLTLVATSQRLEAQNVPPAQGDEQKQIETLQSPGATEFDKAKACQRLAVIGTRKSVPVLAAMLADEKLAHYARYGLEPIPDTSVDDALRSAMGRLKGSLLVGVVNSIGQRKDAKAADGLIRLLGDSDAEVAAAAAAALGRIANDPAAEALQQALSSGGKLRPALGDAGLACAEGLAAQGKRDQAVALYDVLRKADLPKHVRMAATRGAILARQAAGVPLLVEQLRSDDPGMFAVALRAARELAGDEASRALLAEMDTLAPERQAVLVQVLVERGGPAALPVALKAAKSGPSKVRVAAIRMLGKSGDASVLPVLLEAAVEADADLAEAAQASLAALPGREVDDALLALLGRGDPKTRRLVIDVLGQRRAMAAVPALLKAADDSDQPVRLAAVKALGQTVDLENLSVLTDRLLRPKSDEETAAAQQALKVACTRMPDRDACAERLLAVMREAPVPVKCFLLEALGAAGGAKALDAVVAAAKGDDDQVQDAAFRVLGEWMTADAAPRLLELAKATTSAKFKVRALRGYIRIFRQLNLPADQRIAMFGEAMAQADRVEEKKLAVEALGRAPDAKALALALTYLDNPELKEEACKAAVAIAEKISRTDRAAVADAMQKVIQATGSEDVAKRAKTVLGRTAKKPAGKKAAAKKTAGKRQAR